MTDLAKRDLHVLLTLRANMVRGIEAIALHPEATGEARAGAHLQAALLPAFDRAIRAHGVEPEPVEWLDLLTSPGEV